MQTQIHPPVFLDEVERRIDRALAWDDAAAWSELPTMAEAARHLCLAPGAKRARPRLIQLFGQALAAPVDGLADVAVAAEFIHGASLMHDDVIDEGTTRRGLPTVNARWDNLTAVLAGDLLLSEAIYGLYRWPRPITNEALQVVAAMSRAAMLEAHARGRVATSLDQWRYIAEGKTGAMFRWCGRAAAHLAGDDVALDRFGRFGDRFGVAFQMADDLKDLLAEDFGKDRFADIRNRNPSYALLLATGRSPALRADFERAWATPSLAEPEIAALGEAVLAEGALQLTHQHLGREIAAALDALGPYRDRPGCAEIAQWALATWQALEVK